MTAMQHMVDLETIDTAVSAIVVSIGLVEFDPTTFDITNELYLVLDMDEQLRKGRTRSSATMDWWAQQSPEARSVFQAARHPIETVLDATTICLKDTDGLWGNGADFDNIILGSLYASFGRPKPWSYSKNRCHRTMKNLIKPKDYVKPERLGTHHNALDDARYQVRELQAICTALNVRI